MKALFLLACLTLAGCKLGHDMTACRNMCHPRPVVQYNNEMCTCDKDADVEFRCAGGGAPAVVEKQ